MNVMNTYISQIGRWWCMMMSEVVFFTRCSSSAGSPIFLFMFPPSSPPLSLLSTLFKFPPSLPPPSTIAVSCPRWQRWAVPLSELRAAGAVNIRLVVCCMFSTNIKDTPQHEDGVMFSLWDGWARPVCLWNQERKASRKTSGLSLSHLYFT